MAQAQAGGHESPCLYEGPSAFEFQAQPVLHREDSLPDREPRHSAQTVKGSPPGNAGIGPSPSAALPGVSASSVSVSTYLRVFLTEQAGGVCSPLPGVSGQNQNVLNRLVKGTPERMLL